MPQSLIRKAGLLENYHITRHSLRFDSCVIVAARYISPENSILDVGTLYSALRIVVEAHGALCVRIIDETTLGKSPAFSRLQSIDLSRIVHYCDKGESLSQIMEEQFSQRFDTSSDLPLWRLTVLEDCTVVFAWHHCIGDGMSGLAVHRSLLAALRKVQSSTDTTRTITVPESITITPTIETLTDLTPSWRKFLNELYASIVPASWTPLDSAWTGNLVHNDFGLKTHVKILDFSPQDIAAFLAICRNQQATLTSTFHVLSVSVLSRIILAEADSQHHKTIPVSIPISLRRVANMPTDVFGEFVSGYMCYTPLEPDFSWDRASEYASILRTQATESRGEIGMLKYLFGNYTAYFTGKLDKKRTVGMELSNLGSYPADNIELAKTWTLEDVRFAQCDAVVGPAIKLNVAGAPTGGVSMTITFGEGAVSASIVDMFAVKFLEAFKALLD